MPRKVRSRPVQRSASTSLRNAAWISRSLRGPRSSVDRKSTRLNSSTNAHPVCRLLLEKKNQVTSTPNSLMTKPHQCVLRISHLYLQERTTQNITCRSLQTTTNHIKSTSCLLINSYSIHTTYST